MSRPFPRTVSFREVLFHDLISFLVGILFLFAIVCLLSLIILVGLLGAPPPKESPSEIFWGFLVITGLVIAVLRFRVVCITEMLNRGEVVVAEVLRGLAYQFFVQILVTYMVRGEVIQKILWLPNTKCPRALTKEEQVSLAVHTEKTRRAVVRNLYLQGPT